MEKKRNIRKKKGKLEERKEGQREGRKERIIKCLDPLISVMVCLTKIKDMLYIIDQNV